tara:strand:+ start:8159 stop:8944 length:786 start_codon:yes stop_codon:yes gene_type:complete
MKQKLWIFGDSFADRKLTHLHLNPISGKPPIYFEGWSYWLENDYEVENFAQSGIGADTCFLELTNKVDNETHDLENISVVFVFPEALSRVKLTGYEKHKSWTFPFHAYDREQYSKILMDANLNKGQAERYSNYDKYHEFVKVFLTDYIETDEYQNKTNTLLSALDCYANHFKRFMLLPANNISGNTKNKKANHFKNMTIREDISLYKLADQGELPNDEMFKLLRARGSNINVNDPRMLYPNHLDHKHNKIVYDIIKDFMET